jgi:hypothetical protein
VKPTCHYCGKPVAERLAYRRIAGWEQKGISATRRSGSDIILREPLSEFACRSCIIDRKYGRTAGQERLM